MWETRKPHVGQTARRSRLISARDIELFTEMTGDRNPLHYDSEYAAASPFGAIIVQGGVTTGILNAIVAEQLPGPGSVFLHVDWSFRAPVRPGDTITAVVEIMSVRDDKPVSQIKTTVLRQDDVVALEGTAVCYTVPGSQSNPV
jgi:acyl dehydratase